MNLPPFRSKRPATAAKSATAPVPALPKQSTEVKDSVREWIETIVFVVVLVLMLKTFLAEAFVIPTGSMADTLLATITRSSASSAARRTWSTPAPDQESSNPDRVPRITKCLCENCGHVNVLNRPEPIRGPQ